MRRFAWGRAYCWGRWLIPATALSVSSKFSVTLREVPFWKEWNKQTGNNMKATDQITSTGLGRIMLHAICMVRSPRHLAWHCQGILRELHLSLPHHRPSLAGPPWPDRMLCSHGPDTPVRSGAVQIPKHHCHEPAGQFRPRLFSGPRTSHRNQCQHWRDNVHKPNPRNRRRDQRRHHRHSPTRRRQQF